MDENEVEESSEINIAGADLLKQAIDDLDAAIALLQDAAANFFDGGDVEFSDSLELFCHALNLKVRTRYSNIIDALEAKAIEDGN